MPSKTSVDTTLVFDKRNFESRSGITPFVCSTYQDFKDEYAVLYNKVFPELQALCQIRGAYFNPTHLRWSTSQENVQKGHLLNACLNYIRRCAPFFIGIIGERYGHHRDTELTQLSINSIKDSPDGSLDWWDKNLVTSFESGYDWILEEVTQYNSILEIQVLLAAFREDQEFCHFYYRQPEHKDNLYTDLSEDKRIQKLVIYEPESDYCNLKVRELKQRIIKKGHPVKYFQTVQQLCGFVLDDWKGVIDQLCPPICQSIGVHCQNDESIYKDWQTHETYADLRRKDFICLPEHDDLLIDLTQFALTALDDPPEGWDQEEDGNALVSRLMDKHPEYPPAQYTSIYAVVGDRGSGKTSLISHWVKEFTQEYGFIRVFTHYVGCNNDSTDVTSMLNRCMSFFSNQLHHNIEYIEETCGVEESLRSLGEVFTAAVAHQPCVIVLDGLDDLGKSHFRPNEKARDLSWLLYPLPPHVRVIVTTCRSDVSCQTLNKRPDTKLIDMSQLTSYSSKLEVLDHHLGLVKHQLSSEGRQSIMRSHQTEKPLFLSILASELRQPQVYSQDENYVEKYLEANSVRELMSKVIKHWLDCYSWTTNKNAVITNGFKKKSENIRDTSGWVAEVLRILAVSRNGLTETEILQILHHLGYRANSAVSEFDWLLFRDVMQDIVMYESVNGLMTFRHLHVREAVEHSLLSPEAPKMKPEFSINAIIPKKQPDPSKSRKQIERTLYNKALANFFFNKPHSDRRTQELPWQLLGCKDYKRLKQAVCEPSLFMSLYGNSDRRGDLLYFWDCLENHGYDPSVCYVDMLASFSHNNEVPEITITTEEAEPNISNKKEVTFDVEEDINTEVTPTKDGLDIDRLALYVGKLLADMEHYDTALSVLSQLHSSIYQRFPLDSKTEQLFCDVENNIASQFLQLDMLEESTKFYERTLSSVTDLLATLLTPEQENQLIEIKGKVLTHLASLYIIQQKKEEANQSLTQAQRCLNQCGCVMATTQVLLTTGVLRLEEKEYFRADRCLNEAVLAFEKWYGKNHHKVADVLHEYAGLLCNPRNTHRYEKESAEKMYRRALKLREQNYGGSHIIVAETLANFGKLLKTFKDTSDRNEAVIMLRRAHDIRTTQLGPEHPSTKEVYKVLNDLDVSLQYNSRPHKYTESRPNNQLHSALSWHDTDLLQMQLRSSRRKAKQRNKKLSMAIKAVNMFMSIKSAENDTQRHVTDDSLKDKSESVTWDLNSPYKDTATISASDMTFTISDTDIGWQTNTQGEELGTIQESDRSHSDLSEAEENIYLHSDIQSHQQTIIYGDIQRENEGNEKFNMEQTVTRNDPGVDPDSQVHQDSTQHQSSSVIKAILSSNLSDSSKFSVNSRPVSKVEIKTVDSSDYLDNFSEDTSVESPKIIAKAKLLRPQSAPFKMLQKYQTYQSSLRTTPIATSSVTSVVKHAKREVSSAPIVPYTRNHTDYHHHSKKSTHKRVCGPPGPHAMHSSNVVSVVNGPLSSTESLLAPQVPRQTNQRLHHTSAWYHVPGRYTTPEAFYPPKRNQKRVNNAQKKLVKNLKSRSAGKLLSSQFPTYLSSNSSHF